VIWRGFFKIATGYSAIGRNVLFRLHNYGIFAKPEYLPSHPDIDPIYLSYLSKYDKIKVSNRRQHNQIKILSHTPLHDNFRGRKIIFTMLETETLHPDFVNMCNQYNEVWVPCSHNYKLFTRGGVKVPVHVVRLGVDEKIYFEGNDIGLNVQDGLMPLLGNGLKKFKFISLFQWGGRKCPDILIKSFVNAFSNKDDVSLIIVNHYGDVSAICNEVRSYAKSIRASGFPSIFLYNRTPMDRQMPALYKFCDAFISTSRGEGFSLPHVEAGACGLPIISAYHTAMKDYLNDDNSYLVNVQKKEVCPLELAACCGWYTGQLFNVIGQDEMCQFSDRMQFVVNNYEEALRKAKKFKNIVKNNYTWDITASLVARRIREMK
jgi:glycosyltransferase involved in cell wall biosynthesis